MKKTLLILTVLTISVFSFTACSDDDDSNPEQYVEFTFDGSTYKGTGIIAIEAYYDGSSTTVACQQSGYYFWIEITGNTTGTYTKSSTDAAMTVEASEGNYDAYNGDGMSTSFEIKVTQYNDYIKGTFTGTLEGGASGDVVKNVSGSFYVKVVDESY
ncbi:MAG: hypothetical protein K8R31_00205 [Bacteroidales bacterium]|nr:hypothetical protein [Bacteroidales bacterium]